MKRVSNDELQWRPESDEEGRWPGLHKKVLNDTQVEF